MLFIEITNVAVARKMAALAFPGTGSPTITGARVLLDGGNFPSGLILA